MRLIRGNLAICGKITFAFIYPLTPQCHLRKSFPEIDWQVFENTYTQLCSYSIVYSIKRLDSTDVCEQGFDWINYGLSTVEYYIIVKRMRNVSVCCHGRIYGIVLLTENKMEKKCLVCYHLYKKGWSTNLYKCAYINIKECTIF